MPDPSATLFSGGLFSGIGGLEYGMAQHGHRPLVFCEIDAAARSVLHRWQPKARLHEDIRTLEDLPIGLTLLAAGFPCTDLSIAGLKAGIEGKNSSLMGEVFRLLARRRIPNVIIENVPFMLQLKGGTGIKAVTDGLSHLGYRWAYRTIDSRFFGLPQRRERVYIFASTEHDPREILLSDDAGVTKRPDPRSIDIERHAIGFNHHEGAAGWGMAIDSVPPLRVSSTIGIPTPPAILLPDGTVGTPHVEDGERLQGYPTAWTSVADTVVRNARWRLLGNSVSVPVPSWIGHRMLQPRSYDPSGDDLVSSEKWPKAAYDTGKGTFRSRVSTNAIDHPMPRIQDWLNHPLKPLSAKATRGFLGRISKSGLRLPERFLAKLEMHSERMQPS